MQRVLESHHLLRSPKLSLAAMMLRMLGSHHLPDQQTLSATTETWSLTLGAVAEAQHSTLRPSTEKSLGVTILTQANCRCHHIRYLFFHHKRLCMPVLASAHSKHLAHRSRPADADPSATPVHGTQQNKMVLLEKVRHHGLHLSFSP